MGLLDVLLGTSDTRLTDAYQRAWWEADRGYVDPYKYPYLDRELNVYAKENNCTYKEAYIFAKTGKKTWLSKDSVTFNGFEETQDYSEFEADYDDDDEYDKRKKSEYDLTDEEEDELLDKYFSDYPEEKEEFDDLEQEYHKRVRAFCETREILKQLDKQINEKTAIENQSTDSKVIEKNKELIRELKYEKEIQEYNFFEDSKNHSIALRAYFDCRFELLRRALEEYDMEND